MPKKVFGYGSLMWDKEIKSINVTKGRLVGAHRSYNQISTKNWGTPEKPGLVLGLELGGDCEGLILEVSDQVFNDIRAREGPAYILVDASTKNEQNIRVEQNGKPVDCYVYISNTKHKNYVGDKTFDERVKMASTAKGTKGSSCEYIIRNAQAASLNHIEDPCLNEMMRAAANTGQYIKNGKDFLERVKSHVTKNLDKAISLPPDILNEQHFPADKTIRELYNEVLSCYYSNLHNASLSVAMELLEYLSKRLFQELNGGDYPTQDWSNILDQLLARAKSKDDRAGQYILEKTNFFRSNVRNAQNHGNILQLVSSNATFYHNAIELNTITGEQTSTVKSMKYNSKIHSEKDYLAAKDEIQNKGTAEALTVINMFIVHYFITRYFN